MTLQEKLGLELATWLISRDENNPSHSPSSPTVKKHPKVPSECNLGILLHRGCQNSTQLTAW